MVTDILTVSTNGHHEPDRSDLDAQIDLARLKSIVRRVRGMIQDMETRPDFVDDRTWAGLLTRGLEIFVTNQLDGGTDAVVEIVSDEPGSRWAVKSLASSTYYQVSILYGHFGCTCKYYERYGDRYQCKHFMAARMQWRLLYEGLRPDPSVEPGPEGFDSVGA